MEHKDKEAGFLNVFHRMGSLIMAYAFHDTLPDKDEDEDMDSDDEDEEEEEKVNVSMVPMADMLNHKTGHNNVSRIFFFFFFLFFYFIPCHIAVLETACCWRNDRRY
jgi:SET domain-containing protein 6